MRIISGIFKGRIIQASKGIRPTQDNVRKSLFDILGDISGCSFLELFAGSGSVGLEAASRGAEAVVFVEKNRGSIKALRANTALCGLSDYRLYPQDAGKAVKQLHKKNTVFDIVFFDPPYHIGWAKKILQILGAYDIVAPTGFIVGQHFRKEILPEKINNFELFRQNYYGDTALSFYRKCK